MIKHFVYAVQCLFVMNVFFTGGGGRMEAEDESL